MLNAPPVIKKNTGKKQILAFPPQTGRRLRVGFVPLCDSAPFVVAAEFGLFREQGISVNLQRELGWASIRDRVVYGELDAAQAVSGLPFAATLGVGTPPVPCVSSMILNLHGNGITLATRFKEAGVRDARTLKRHLLDQDATLTVGIVSRYSSHHFVLRRWLQMGGIDPEHRVQFVVVPPPQMPVHLKEGHIDAFCAGEPWNTVAEHLKAGWLISSSADVAPLHPEKVLVVREAFAQERFEEHIALTVALLRACAICDDPEQRPEIIRLLSRREYVDVPEGQLAAAFAGREFLIFNQAGANRPTPERASWILSQLAGCGAITHEQSLEARTVFRPDLFDLALSHTLPHSLENQTKKAL